MSGNSSDILPLAVDVDSENRIITLEEDHQQVEPTLPIIEATTRSPHGHSTCQAELVRVSSRPYSLRVDDVDDIASVWESVMIPLLVGLLQRYSSSSDVAIDIHSFPEISGDTLVRVIYLSVADADLVDIFTLEKQIRHEVSAAVPAGFDPVYLKIHRGNLHKDTGCQQAEPINWRDHINKSTPPPNGAPRPLPIVGTSVGNITIKNAVGVEGNAEVYVLTQANGWTAGFTSDVPGLQYTGGVLHREWSVRMPSSSSGQASTDNDLVSSVQKPNKRGRSDGIRAPENSGGWLIRRCDNALMGLVSSRCRSRYVPINSHVKGMLALTVDAQQIKNQDHNRSFPMGRVRLAYFTPILDILANTGENEPANEESILLQTHLSGEVLDPHRWKQDSADDATGNNRKGTNHGQSSVTALRAGGFLSACEDPWSVLARDPIQHHRQMQESILRRNFAFGGALPAKWNHEPLQPYLNKEVFPEEHLQATQEQSETRGLEQPVQRAELASLSSVDEISIKAMQTDTQTPSEGSVNSIITLCSHEKLELRGGVNPVLISGPSL